MSVLELLVKHANPLTKNKDGLTVFHIASKLYITDPLQLLLNVFPDYDLDIPDGNELTCLHHAASSENSAAIEILLNKKAALDPRSSKGSTPLFLAASLGKLDNVRLLHQHGAELEARLTRDFNLTPLLIASWKNHLEVVRWLGESGADMLATTAYG